jgi:hypothetical protein
MRSPDTCDEGCILAAVRSSKAAQGKKAKARRKILRAGNIPWDFHC